MLTGVTRVEVRSRDAGFSAVELVIAMSIFSVLMVAFMSAVMLMTRTTTVTGQIARGATQLRQVFDNLGRTVESASGVNTPTLVGQDLYIEFRTDAVVAGSAAVCTQWRYRPTAAVIEERSWSPLDAAPTAWRTLAAAVVNDVTTQPPFTVQAADSVHTLPLVTFDIRIHPTGSPMTSDAGIYAARDYVAGGPSPVCTEVGRS